MRKPDFCICGNKGADQLCGNRTTDQRLCFRYTDTTIPLLSKSKISTFFCGCTARFVSDLVGNPEDRFSHNEGQFILVINLIRIVKTYFNRIQTDDTAYTFKINTEDQK